MKGKPTDFWGKLERDEQGTVIGWHPLVDHCADVAAVCEALLSLPTWRARLARLAGWDSIDDTTVARLVVLAALHDIGKFNLGFQAKGRSDLGVAERGHVGEGLGALSRDEVVSALRPGEIVSWGEPLDELLKASICHHGRPPNGDDAVNQNVLWRSESGLSPVAGVRALRALTVHWAPAAFSEGKTLPDGPAFSHAFAGLVMLADWLGSDTRFFPYSETRSEDPLARFGWARAQAKKALQQIGLDVEQARTASPFAEAFEAVSAFNPRAAQRAIAELPVPQSGSVVVLESETGSGKTEAALAYFIKLFVAGAVDGVYFALPTRTAATQIHRRVTAAMSRAFGGRAPPVVLAVPGYLQVDDVVGTRLPEFKVLWPDLKSDANRHRGWAAEQPKRYLAGCVVVGTVDQVLLSSLQVGHAHLRATALLRHLVVVDEVHASDAYMTRILDEVLRYHRAAGGHALLLSATLGGQARSDLVASRRLGSVPLEEALATPYPAVTSPAVSGSGTAGVVHDGASKSVSVRPRTILEDPAEIATLALEAALDGAKVIVLRNTVADCLDVQAALEEQARSRGRDDLLFHARGVAAPHHARFSRADRGILDDAVEQAFGKNRVAGAGCVLVATQTIQQSLDLDADLLLTDLCPIDVLLQRIGRLHRHSVGRPRGFERAVVDVLVPKNRDLGTLIGKDGSGRHHHGLGSVYADLRMLETTWRLIGSGATWTVPVDCRRLVEHGLHADVLAAVVEELGGPWTLHAQKGLGKVLADRRVAGLNLVNRAQAYTAEPFPSDRRVPSRLGESDRLVELEPPFAGPFGEPVRQLTVRAAWSRAARDDETQATSVDGKPGGAEFSFASRRFSYSRHGLQLRQTDLPEDDDA